MDISNKLEIAKAYGEVIEDNGEFRTTKCDRTGCVYCLFGISQDVGENRIQRLQQTHPQLHSYCMDKLGFREVCNYMNIPCEKEQCDMFKEIEN